VEVASCAKAAALKATVAQAGAGTVVALSTQELTVVESEPQPQVRRVPGESFPAWQASFMSRWADERPRDRRRSRCGARRGTAGATRRSACCAATSAAPSTTGRRCGRLASAHWCTAWGCW
jgi:hypothetical protein